MGQVARMNFERAIEFVTQVIDGVGVAIVGGGSLFVLLRHGVRIFRQPSQSSYSELRSQLGRAILLGLEFLVAADIIRTVAATPTFRGIGVLALIVLIRTFLSMTLEMEVSGRVPWHRASRQAE